MHFPAVILFYFGCLALSVHGLKCYTCTLTVKEGETDPDLRCVNDPANVPGKNVLTCPSRMKFCTIVRNDYKPSGTVSSIERNCSEDPVILNEDIESDELISHYRSCTTDLCNKGTGLEAPDNGSGGGGEGIGGMIVNGKSSSVVVKASLSLLVVFSMIVWL